MAFTTVSGTTGAPDSFFGTAGVDAITIGPLTSGAWLGARQSDDYIAFNSGSSSIATAYTLNGGSDNDSFVSQASTKLSRSRLLGDSGIDTFSLTGVSGSTISGGQGSDQINTAGLVTSSLINGNQDPDQISINAGASSSSIFGGIGDDTVSLTTQLNQSVVQANEGDDVLAIASGTSITGSTINGNQGNDTITVNAIAAFASSTLFGGDGNDTINATNSNVGVVAQGDGGNDQLTGGTGDDTLTGGTGNDQLTGGAGVDSFQVDSGTDAITDLGNGGNDEIDVAAGATANATVTAAYTTQANSSNNGILNATLTNSLAADSTISFDALGGTNGVSPSGLASINRIRLTGSANADTIIGGDGNDTLTGGSGSDNISDAAGNNFFIGGAGNDTITGGPGNDRFTFSRTLIGGIAGTITAVRPSVGTDTISEFVASGAFDRFSLVRAVFGNSVASIHGLLSGSNFVSQVGAGVITTAAGQGNNIGADGGIIYDQTSRTIYWIQPGTVIVSGATTLSGLVANDSATSIAVINNLISTQPNGIGSDSFIVVN